ncbi:MAG: MBL fold metallo-hydrolase [Lachnospiraceae bacterium]|nr:MBL fold metallo-hydrolase [Lachnospiraceae bacterium]
MEIRVLVDNNTFIDQYYLGEPAASFYMEVDKKRILFDCGYSDVLLKNAEKMKIDLNKLDVIVLSHGHNDHTGGLVHLTEQCDLSGCKLVAHPDCFHKKQFEGEPIGSPLTLPQLSKLIEIELSREPARLTENLFFLGEIPEYFTYEKREPIGECERNGKWIPDQLLDDTALAYKTSDGVFIITGCSHSGICNIAEYAKKITGCEKISGILGGFHIFKESEKLTGTIQYLKENQIQKLYPSHCVSFRAKAMIDREIRISDVAVGRLIQV